MGVSGRRQTLVLVLPFTRNGRKRARTGMGANSSGPFASLKRCTKRYKRRGNDEERAVALALAPPDGFRSFEAFGFERAEAWVIGD